MKKLSSRRTWIVVIALFSLLLGSCLQRTALRYESSEGRFSILMPGEVKTDKMKLDALSEPIDLYLFFVEKDQIVYLVGYSDYSAIGIAMSSPDTLLEAAVAGAVSATGGELLSKEIISLRKYPGREVMIAGPEDKFIIHYRYFLVGNRLYQVGVVSPKENKSESESDFFFDSFKILY